MKTSSIGFATDRRVTKTTPSVGATTALCILSMVRSVAGIDPAELVLLNPFGVCFRFLEKPEIKHHTIYIRFTDKEQVLNCMLEYDFE